MRVRRECRGSIGRQENCRSREGEYRGKEKQGFCRKGAAWEKAVRAGWNRETHDRVGDSNRGKGKDVAEKGRCG